MHCQLNECRNINCQTAELEDIDEDLYDVILANINRNVLLNDVEGLSVRLNPGGDLLLSGILEEDELLIREAYESLGFIHLNTMKKNQWLCMHWTL